MERLKEICRRLRVLFRRERFDRDLEEEMRTHLEMQAEENCENGMAAEEAHHAAQRQFGNATLLRESSREIWGWAAVERFLQDLRYAARTLRNSPGFSGVVILMLALGIGVNTAIFSFVDRLLLRPLPLPESGRLASLNFRSTRSSYVNDGLSYPDYVYFRDHNRVFSGLAAYGDTEGEFRLGGQLEKVSGEFVSANYFGVLGAPPILGRGFVPDEDRVPGRDPVVVLSYDFWQRRFGGDAGIAGRQVTIDDVKFRIVGIARPGFSGLRLDRAEKPEFWVPTMMYPVLFAFGGYDLQHHWGNHWLSATGRLKPGITLAQAEANISTLTRQLQNSHWRLWVDTSDGPLQSVALLVGANQARFAVESRKGVVTFLGMLLAVVGLVLLIACSNVASLILARAAKRRNEIGVRLALGAGRRRLAQQLITESLLLSVLGGAAGLAVAWLTCQALAGYDKPFRMALLLETDLDGRILVFALGLSLLTGLIFGLVPLRQAFRVELVPALKRDTSRSGPRGFGFRSFLVVAQVALSLILLVGASLFVRTLRNAQATDVTRDADRVLLIELNLAERKYEQARARQFYADLAERVNAMGGVENVALVARAPMGGGKNSLDVTGPGGAWKSNVDFNVVSEDYFRTIGLPLLRGRTFTSADREGAPGVAVINEVMAGRFWPGDNPIGKRFEYFTPPRQVEVVGVIRDGRFRNYRDTVWPCFYLPFQQLVGEDFLTRIVSRQMKLEVRTAGNPAPVAEGIRGAIHALDKDLPVPGIQTLASYRDAGLGQERLTATLLSGLGFLAVLIAAVGLYGVLAFAVAQRTREIGIRIALGAGLRQVQRGILIQALGLVGVGLAIGCVAARILARYASSLLFGITATDLETYAVTAGILIVVSAVAAYLPARRASRVDPIVALRYE